MNSSLIKLENVIPATLPATKVLIYIANTPNQGYLNQVLTWLSSNHDSEILEIVSRIKNDLLKFPDAVLSEVKALRESVSKPDSPANLVVVTTESLLDGYLEIRFAGMFQSTRVELTNPLPATACRIQPMISAETFDFILDQIALRFDPKQFEFVLITKSHGNEKLALTSLMAGKLDIFEGEKLTRAIKEARKKLEESKNE